MTKKIPMPNGIEKIQGLPMQVGGRITTPVLSHSRKEFAFGRESLRCEDSNPFRTRPTFDFSHENAFDARQSRVLACFREKAAWFVAWNGSALGAHAHFRIRKEDSSLRGIKPRENKPE
jgi:hypothetical protein